MGLECMHLVGPEVQDQASSATEKLRKEIEMRIANRDRPDRDRRKEDKHIHIPSRQPDRPSLLHMKEGATEVDPGVVSCEIVGVVVGVEAEEIVGNSVCQCTARRRLSRVNKAPLQDEMNNDLPTC